MTAAPGTINSTLEQPSRSEGASSEGAVWEKALDAVLQFLDEPGKHLQLFFSDYKRPALSLAIILGTVMTYRVLDSMLDAIDEVPGLRGLFQLVGLFYVGRLGVRRLFKAEARARTFTELKDIWSRITGDRTAADSKPAAQSISQPAEPYIEVDSSTTEAETTEETIEVTPMPEGVSTADLIRATAQAAQVRSESAAQREMFAGVTGTVQVLIPLTGVVDVESLRAKLEKDLAKAEGEMKSLNGRLGNQGFVSQAPAAVVQGARDALAEAEKQATLVKERLAML
ncbi:CAAD domain-containing protein [Synechococcus sp. PCC 7335]|uniref:CAAD domain-containing protein n=1 Tax=Synechococcus sp. (strain ATCC 29403 / PCC 7335) TaxID=91464 RepID=UPI002100AA1C|nr:CAAD domain-containing protein [Synechococcus sp. PCC 7335]